MLRRLGNKKKLISKLVPLFPQHETYFEPFLGTGSVFFAKPLCKHNYLNDLDNDVYNLFNVCMTNEKLLYELIELMPLHNELFQYLRKNELLSNEKFPDDVMKEARFLYLSNYSFLGKMDILKFGNANDKKVLLSDMKKATHKLRYAQFNNKDFRKFFSDFSFRGGRTNEYKKTFIYADPPYLNTANNYSSGFTIDDTKDLFEILVNLGTKGVKFMISEFKNPEILELAKKYNLFVTEIAERQTLKSRNTEIIVTNYDVNLKLF